MDSPCYIGIPTVSHEGRPFAMGQTDRRQHLYAIGKSGYGKSTLLRNLALQDIEAGKGLCFVDPHGGEAEALIEHIPPWRADDFVYINPADLAYPVAFNLLENVPKDERALRTSQVLSIFKRFWDLDESRTPRLLWILYNTVAALLDYPYGATLLGIPRMLGDETYRARIVGSIQDSQVRNYWEQEFKNYTDRYRVEAVAPVQNKVGQLLAPPVIRNMVGQVKSTIDPRHLMDCGKIVIVRLPVGTLGEGVANLIGSVLVTGFQLAALERASETKVKHPDFHLSVDEMYRFTTDSFVSILSEARKGCLCLALAHQFIEQIPREVQAAIFGNVGTLISFRVGARDAVAIAPEFAPRSAESLQELGRGEICIRLLCDGELRDPFTARTLVPEQEPYGVSEMLIGQSRRHYARQREVVEDRIVRWMNE